MRCLGVVASCVEVGGGGDGYGEPWEGGIGV
jgi:hypothetical protein